MTGEPTMAALLPITGTVSVSLDGCEAVGLGTFSVPVTTSVDAATGDIHLHAATEDAISLAMADALRAAADQILATIPNAKVETVATCEVCGVQLGGMDASTILMHADDGAHVADLRY